MFEDILTDPEPFEKFGPSHLHIQYFRDGEIREYEVSITSQELLNALPLFLPNLNKDRLDEFIEFIKAHLLLEKCLLMESSMV